MATFPEKSSQWWDRDVDRAGRPIREDVRTAAHEIWQQARRRARALLGDDHDTAGIIEDCVESVSRYLDQKNLTVGSIPVAGLLMRAFCCRVRKRQQKTQRIELIGGVAELEDQAATQDWTQSIDDCLDLEKILTQLSPRSGRILLLRLKERTWTEIAGELRMSESTAQDSFWREIRRLKLKLTSNRLKDDSVE